MKLKSRKQILSALAALAVLSAATGATAFAASIADKEDTAPAVTEEVAEEAEAEAANGLLKAFFAGRVPSMISALVKRKRLSEADLDEICKALKVERVK